MYLFKVNIGNTKTIYQICGKLTLRALERRDSIVFIDNFDETSLTVFVFPLLTLNK